MSSGYENTNVTDPSGAPPAYSRKVAEVNILFLGSPGTGKSTFISRLATIGAQPAASPTPARDVDLERRPFPFSVSLFRRPYKINLWPSVGTLFTDEYPDQPDFVIITYDISDRASLHNARYYWRKQFTIHYEELEQATPVMLLGLKRDLRTDEVDENGQYVCVMPQEGLNAATNMRCDKYAECSAVTGELFKTAVEDITRVAAMTTTEKGGLSQGSACVAM